METTEALKLKFKSQVEEWKAEFDKLQAESKGAYAEGAIEADPNYKSLKRKYEMAQSKAEEFENANEEKLEELKQKFEQEWKQLKSTLDSLRKK